MTENMVWLKIETVCPYCGFRLKVVPSLSMPKETLCNMCKQRVVFSLKLVAHKEPSTKIPTGHTGQIPLGVSSEVTRWVCSTYCDKCCKITSHTSLCKCYWCDECNNPELDIVL